MLEASSQEIEMQNPIIVLGVGCGGLALNLLSALCFYGLLIILILKGYVSEVEQCTTKQKISNLALTLKSRSAAPGLV